MTAALDTAPAQRRGAAGHSSTLASSRRCVESSRMRAEHYQARAREAADLATQSLLSQVREKHETAADAWAKLAELEHRITASALARLSRPPAPAELPAAA